jgi:hypothetical protein
METALILTFGLLLMMSGVLLWRRPFNVVGIVGVLTTVFGLFPAFYSYYTLEDINAFYSWRNFVTYMSVISSPSHILQGIAALSLMAFAWLAGGFVALNRAGNKDDVASALGQGAFWRGNKVAGQLLPLLFAVWAVAAFYFYLRAGSLQVFLLPINVRNEAEGPSGYMTVLYMMLPLVMLVLAVLREGKFGTLAWVFVALSVMATFSTHQRRELVTTALFVVGMHVFVADLLRTAPYAAGEWKAALARRLRWSRRVAVAVFGLGLCMVPMLWFTRVYFTSAYNQGTAVNPFEIRSFMDVLFGSPATGFPTFMLIRDYVAQYGMEFLYTFKYLLALPVPRSVWPNKPVDVDTVIEKTYELTENPSVFWFGELYFNLAWLAVPVAFAIGWWLFAAAERTRTAPSLLARLLGAAVFMQSITLFKNGFSTFAIRVGVLMVMLWAVFKVVEVLTPPAQAKRIGGKG